MKSGCQAMLARWERKAGFICGVFLSCGALVFRWLGRCSFASCAASLSFSLTSVELHFARKILLYLWYYRDSIRVNTVRQRYPIYIGISITWFIGKGGTSQRKWPRHTTRVRQSFNLNLQSTQLSGLIRSATSLLTCSLYTCSCCMMTYVDTFLSWAK